MMTDATIHALLIDDDEDDFVMLRDLAGEMPESRLKLSWVGTAEEGAAAIARQEHDIYLLDYRLGARTGLDLMREAIARGVARPFILLTGHGDHAIDLEAMQAGAADYLVKGQITTQVLARAVRYAIHKAQTLAVLREREENFRTLLDSTFEGVLVHDEHGAISLINRAAARIFGYELTEMLGTNVLKYCGDACRDPILTQWGSAREVSVEATGVRKDGSPINLRVSCKPYHYKGRDLRLTALRDITSAKQMEAQILMQDRLASIGLLASSLAHEIGTPLGVIRGRAEFLGYQLRESPELKKNVDIIASQIDRVSHLIRSLLNLARGDKVKTVASLALHEVVGEVVDLMGHEFRRANITVENSLSPTLKLDVKAEAGPLHQVLLNLLVNAVHAIESARKAGRADGHTIRLEADEQPGRLVLSVRDTGCGISQANMKKLFTPFFTTKGIGAGTGLGLATSYGIVESWGGSIAVDSQEGVGTTFRITLPR